MGLADLPAGTCAALVFLGDMPAVPHGIAARLIGRLARGARAAHPVAAGRPGHPVALFHSAIAFAASMRGDHGLGPVLRRAHGVACFPTTDPGCRHDIDHPEDLDAIW